MTHEDAIKRFKNLLGSEQRLGSDHTRSGIYGYTEQRTLQAVEALLHEIEKDTEKASKGKCK